MTDTPNTQDRLITLLAEAMHAGYHGHDEYHLGTLRRVASRLEILDEVYDRIDTLDVRRCELCGFAIAEYEAGATRCGACTNAYGDPGTNEPPLAGERTFCYRVPSDHLLDGTLSGITSRQALVDAAEAAALERFGAAFDRAEVDIQVTVRDDAINVVFRWHDAEGADATIPQIEHHA